MNDKTEKGKKDFDPQKLASSIEQHGKDISEFEERVSALEGKLNNPQQLANTLETAAADSKQLDKFFAKVFCDMLNDKDSQVAKVFAEKIDKIDRDAVKSTFKKWKGWFGKAIIFILGYAFSLLTLYLAHKYNF